MGECAHAGTRTSHVWRLDTPLIVLQYRELLEQSGLHTIVQALADETDVSRFTPRSPTACSSLTDPAFAPARCRSQSRDAGNEDVRLVPHVTGHPDVAATVATHVGTHRFRHPPIRPGEYCERLRQDLRGRHGQGQQVRIPLDAALAASRRRVHAVGHR